MSMSVEPTERFSNRVESYRRHRPGYPTAIVDLLAHECGLNDASVIADIAAGTGLLSEIFLSRGYRVIAVEPNQQMRDACATLTSQYPQLQCVDGTAEATSLADNSIDLATVGQAMHWFDLKRTRNEFVRVLRSGGRCTAIYNNRRMAGDAFQEGYEKILVEYGTDYGAVRDSYLTEERLAAFFAPDAMRSAVFVNSQQLTLEALQGRILSSSYMPQAGHPRYSEMSRIIKDLFSENETGGHVRMEYDCVVCYGYLS
jgi:ubiquinone/menaquinone biosynthesis C-methylase UbiE